MDKRKVMSIKVEIPFSLALKNKLKPGRPVPKSASLMNPIMFSDKRIGFLKPIGFLLLSCSCFSSVSSVSSSDSSASSSTSFTICLNRVWAAILRSELFSNSVSPE